MDFYEALAAKAVPVNIEPSSTSYFSKPQVGLDPRLFVNGKLISSVRNGVLTVLYNYLATLYQTPQDWTSAWLAGSGVSHQWAAKRYPGDLDCLVGIDYLAFRQANVKYTGLNNQEIASMLNEGFKEDLWPLTENFLEAFELTFYVNVQSDIKKIKPYAAYSLVNNDWVVEPTIEEAPTNPQWTVKAEKDKGAASEIIARYATALNAVNSSTNSAMRINAERALKLAVDQASALFEDIHQGRKYAFSESGSGYLDYNNYRWQAGKREGTVQMLRHIREHNDVVKEQREKVLYGVNLPDAHDLIRASALYGRP
jgi:hypothetical protein